MKHFGYLDKEERKQIFAHEPVEFTKNSDKELVSYALGATLYMPGTRSRISNDVLSGKFLSGGHEGLTSMVICLEDSISDGEVGDAELNLVLQLQEIKRAVDSGLFRFQDVPLLFIRIRSEEQLHKLAENLGTALELVSGFVFPKFNIEKGESYLRALTEINQAYSQSLYAMPILETPEVIYKETRISTLVEMKELLDRYKDLILNVRMGATDFSGLFGIRRDRDTTIYNIGVISDCITDIINIFGRENEYVISGPVWEYFGKQRIMKPRIRQTPFEVINDGIKLRDAMISRNDDALIYEIVLDRSNGIIGKTIIHPSHIKAVNSLHVVSLEEYMDASAIIESAGSFNGVIKSGFSNKMNEIKPHYNWAKKIILKSKLYGVFHEQQSFLDLLTARSETKLFI
ncbi:HpcH/HpaI aldolase/citrate lyase family protein [Peribacillus deserti]|uniref:Citrate lyase subunit beta n=1 Tax=Peribacillus deserti TaxID=673318 RepID=A0A2N5M9R3_9BACI|nr:HpcH/HpaI aldolase/citrate lyase family protein [Peribacillus deserti]PLT31098.1 citrate lyase subunit beta [Peribacillus deserti]